MRISLVLLALPFALAAQAPAPLPTPPPSTPEQLFEARKYDDARTAFQAVLAKDKNDANALYYMGRIAEVQGRSGEAVDWYEKAVKRNDKSALYHFWLGSGLGAEAQKANKLRQPFLARRVKSEFERAVALDPKMVQPREGLVDFYSIAPGFMGGSMEKAKEQANEIVKLEPLQGHRVLARLAERQKDQVSAEREYRAIVALAPDSSYGYFALASYFRRQSRWDDAFGVYEQLMKAVPSEPQAHLGWGAVAAVSGKNLERGERELRHYLTIAPRDTPPQTLSATHFRMGQIYQAGGKKELAKAEFAEALKLNPQNQDAKKALDALK